ncbi:MAG: hypothetical protein F4X95_00415 [Oligoflexia bacterium]|nr:hypothetical protein [Oligoflexia bacterium]
MKEVSKKENSLLARLTNGLWKLKEVMGPETEPVLAGIWTEESAFLSAIKGLKQKGYKKIRAITPCPIQFSYTHIRANEK